jgi:hypothetical protein
MSPSVMSWVKGQGDLNRSNRPVRIRMPGGVGGERSCLIAPYPDFTACFLPSPARHCRACVSLVLYRDFTQNLWIVFSQERGQSGAQCTPQDPSPASSLMQGLDSPLPTTPREQGDGDTSRPRRPAYGQAHPGFRCFSRRMNVGSCIAAR